MSGVFSIGFFAGTYSVAGNAEQSFVRVGRVLCALGVVDFELWAAARGPAKQDDVSWTRADVLAAYRVRLNERESDGDEFSRLAGDVDSSVSDAAFDRLLTRGLLVEVADADEQVEAGAGRTRLEFAESYRFRGLLRGLGRSQEDEGLEIVGAPVSAGVMLGQSRFELWQLAGQVDSLALMAEQIVADAAAIGETVSLHECLKHLLPELRELASQGLGYFDAIPQNRGPLTYLTLDDVVLDPTDDRDLRITTETRLLNEGEYRSKLSGAPEGLRYLVEDPNTGKDVGYAGFVSGALFDTIATMEGRTPESLAGQARRQLSAAGDYLLVWHVQQADDVDSVRQALRDAGISRIEVRYTPAA